MAQLPNFFDATNIEPAGLPAPQLPISGKEGLAVIIHDSAVKANKNQTGGFLELSLKVIDGQYLNEEGTYRITLANPSEKAVEIGQRQLSAVCHAIGVFQVQDSAQLHNRPFRVVTGYQKLTTEQQAAKDRGEDVTPYTEVKAVLCMDGSMPGKSQNGGKPATTAPANPVPPAAANPAPAVNTAAPAAAWGGVPATAAPEQPAANAAWQHPVNNGAPAPWGGGAA